jgi:hypothetical protein
MGRVHHLGAAPPGDRGRSRSNARYRSQAIDHQLRKASCRSRRASHPAARTVAILAPWRHQLNETRLPLPPGRSRSGEQIHPEQVGERHRLPGQSRRDRQHRPQPVLVGCLAFPGPPLRRQPAGEPREQRIVCRGCARSRPRAERPGARLSCRRGLHLWERELLRDRLDRRSGVAQPQITADGLQIRAWWKISRYSKSAVDNARRVGQIVRCGAAPRPSPAPGITSVGYYRRRPTQTSAATTIELPEVRRPTT